MFILLLLIPHAMAMAQMCLSELDCDPGLRCSPFSNAYKFCVKESIKENIPIMECSSNNDCANDKSCHQDVGGSRCVVYCLHDMDCSSGQTCMLQQDRSSICEIGRSKYMKDSMKGSFNFPCKRDSDCINELSCVDYYGELLCRTSGPSVPPICLTDSDCTAEEQCVYRPTAAILSCQKMPVSNLPSTEEYITEPKMIPETTKDIAQQEDAHSVIVGNLQEAAPEVEKTTQLPFIPAAGYQIPNGVNTSVGYHIGLLEDKPNNTLIPTYDVAKPTKVEKSVVNSVIDPAATPCQYDYQCRMGESCSGIIQMVEHNITVCEYDVERKNRLCIMHSDCLQGQLCQRNATGTFVCEVSLAASVGNISCIYDYECSGGEKCIKIEEKEGKMEFRCRQSQFPDPRRNQKCRSNADCPYQQVCRRLIDAPMCVDIGTVVSNQQPHEIQSKLIKFVHDLLFSRA